MKNRHAGIGAFIVGTLVALFFWSLARKAKLTSANPDAIPDEFK